jgi:hypothetical protein
LDYKGKKRERKWENGQRIRKDRNDKEKRKEKEE